MSLTAAIIWLTVSLTLILVGADKLTEGASAIARRLGVSDLTIGLTAVAFGTSAPELVISVTAAADGNPGMALGNVAGSNTLNILLIIGLTALIRPIAIDRGVMKAELPMLVLSSLVLLTAGYSDVLDGRMPAMLTRVDGIIMLMFFGLFMAHTFASARRTEHDDTMTTTAQTVNCPTAKAAIMAIAGLAALLWGGGKFVDSASALARYMGISDAVIALTVVAVGTSLPELATSAVAAVKGRAGMAVGNVIGSNIFNILLVAGSAAVVSPLPFAGITHADLWVMTGAAVLFFVFAKLFGTRCITRPEGLVMLLSYAAYTVWLLAA